MFLFIRRLWRIVRNLILILLAFAVGAVAVLTTTRKGLDNLAGIISDLASSPGSTVRVVGIDGIWSGALTVDSLVLEDDKGAWLVARGIDVRWSPLTLLSKTFYAERLAVQRIELARLPEKGGSEPKAGGSASLPVALDIRKIEANDIALGPALAGGGVAAISAQGKVKVAASPIEIATDFTVARKDGRAGSIDGAIDFAPDSNKLEVDVRASEPAGGILANILKLPGDPAVDLIVSGSGPIADWNGTGTFSVDGTVVTRVEAHHQQTNRGSYIEAKGDGEFERFVPEILKPLLAGKVDFDFAGTATSTGGVDIERGTIDSAAVHGQVSGTVDPKAASDFALEVTAAGDGVPLSFGTQDAPIDIVVQSATVRALGDGSEPNLDISDVLAKLATNDVELENIDVALHSDGFDIQQRIGPVTGNVAAAQLTIDNPTVAPLVAGRLTVALEGALATDGLTVTKGTFGSDAMSGELAGAVSLTDGSVRLDLKADVASAALPSAARPVLGERAALTATLTRDNEGHVSATPFALTSGPLSASGRIDTSDGTVDAAIDGKLADINLLAKDATGAIDFSLAAKGPFGGPDLSLTVTGDRIEAAGREITGLKLTATGKADAANPAADVSLTGTVAGLPLDGSARLSTSGGRREVKGLSLSLGPNKVSGDLVLDEKFMPLGTVAFTLPDIGPLAALAMQKAEGDLAGTIRFADDNGKPRLTLDARTAALARDDLTARDVTISADVADYIAAPSVSGRVRAGTVTSGKTVIRSVDVALTRDGPWTGFDGGATVADIPARASGRVQVAGGKTIIELASGKATVRGIAVSVARPSRVEVANATATLDKLALNVGGGTAVVSGTAGTALNLNATLSAMPASVANTFSPGLAAAGTISGTAKVSGAAANPTVGYSIDWKGAQTAQTRAAGFGAMSITSSGDFVAGRLTFKANVGDGSGLGMTGGGTVQTTGVPTLALDFKGKVPFSFLTARLAAQGLSLSGGADVSIQVNGPATAPVIGGSVRASGARLIDARTGIAVNDLSADIGLAKGLATIRSMKGTLSSGGSLTASGTVGIDPARGFPADLTIRIVDGRYTDGRIVTANLSGDLAVKGPLASAPALSGTINLARTVITIPDRLPTSLSTLDVKHKNAPASVRAQDEALRPATGSGGGGGGMTLDLTVNANNQIFVQGRGLDAELGGSLRLTGPVSAPRASGQFTLRRGRLEILGKRLTFTRGTITFSGSMVPYLDLSADSTAGDATVTIGVTGPATGPKFVFSSSPALPEDEILARLIFGRSLSNLSPLQIAQLAEAAAQLAGVGGSTSLLQKLRSKIGVDDLNVTTDEQGNAAVSAGKYLNDRTYVTIEKGDKPGSGKATIDLNVGRGVKLRGEANDQGKAKGGIFFEREY